MLGCSPCWGTVTKADRQWGVQQFLEKAGPFFFLMN